MHLRINLDMNPK